MIELLKQTSWINLKGIFTGERHKDHEGNLGKDEAVTFLNCNGSYMTIHIVEIQNSKLKILLLFSI